MEACIADYAKAMAGDNATMEAVKAYFTKPLINPITMLFLFLLSKIQQCSVGRQGVCFRSAEMVLRDQLPEYAEEFVSFAEKGYRVLVFGVYDGILEEPVLTEAVTPLGYILIANPIRKEARATFDYFKNSK